MRYKANFYYFDLIDTPNKAYWLGFLWGDGYIGKRERKQKNGKIRIEYNIKLAIKERDYNHVQKFLNDLESNYPVLFYNTAGFCSETPQKEARAFITNLHMGSLLYEQLKIIPNRWNPSEVIKHIPKKFHKYFILGVFDADGSFSFYYNKGINKKLNVTFGGSELLLRFIEQHLVDNRIINKSEQRRKLFQRHKEKDGTWRTLTLSGTKQGAAVLQYLYDSPIYLSRKYDKFLQILPNII